MEALLEHVIGRMPLQAGFPHACDIMISPSIEQALMQLTLPPRDVVPSDKAHRYVERSDEELPAARSAREIADIYRGTVSQVVLLAFRNVFAADEWLQRVGVNGHVRAIDPATGVVGVPLFDQRRRGA